MPDTPSNGFDIAERGIVLNSAHTRLSELMAAFFEVELKSSEISSISSRTKLVFFNAVTILCGATRQGCDEPAEKD